MIYSLLLFSLFIFGSSFSTPSLGTSTHLTTPVNPAAEDADDEPNPDDWSGTGEADEDIIIQEDVNTNEDEGVTE